MKINLSYKVLIKFKNEFIIFGIIFFWKLIRILVNKIRMHRMWVKYILNN